MGDFPPPRSQATDEPWPAQPHRALEEIRQALQVDAPEVDSLRELVDLLRAELQDYFARHEARDAQLQSALPFGTPHVTYRGEARLQQQHAVLEQAAGFADQVQCLSETPLAERTRLHLRTEFDELTNRLGQYDALHAAEPPPHGNSIAPDE